MTVPIVRGRASPAVRSQGSKPASAQRRFGSGTTDAAVAAGGSGALEIQSTLELQRTAGNRAVAQLILDARDEPGRGIAWPIAGSTRSGARQRTVGHPGMARPAGTSAPGGGAVQRAPDERPKDRSQAALGDTLPGTPPTTSGPAPTVATPDALAATVPGAGNPAAAFDRNAPLRGQAVPVTDAEVAAAFENNPGSVIRSPTTSWHNEIYVLDKGTGGIPQAFRVGDQIAVHPDYPGPATTLPQYAATGDVGLGGTGGQATVPPPQIVPKDQLPGSATIGSVAPASPGGGAGGRPARRVGRPDNWDTARPVTDAEVEAAFQADPASVIRSPSHEWHEEMYDLDEGTGDTYPKAFRVGNQIAVSPDYRGPATALPSYSADGGPGHGPGAGQGGAGGSRAGGTPTGGSTPIGGMVPFGAGPATAGSATRSTPTGGASGPSAGAHAAETVGLPSATYDESSAGRSYTSTVTQQGDQTMTRDRKRELGMVTTGEETSDGELTHRRERVAGAGFGVGGNVVGAQYGRSEATRIGDSYAVSNSRNVTGGINREGKLQVGGERKREVLHGTRPDGTPVKTSSSTTGSVTLDPHSLGGELAKSYGTRGGHEVTGGASFSVDDKGNSSASLTGGVKTKGGYGASVTVSGGHSVTAEDPEELSPGVWEVRFVVADTSSVGGGVSGEAGGFGFGASGSVADADSRTGSRRFTSEQEAKAFKEHAAERIAKDGSLGFFPVTTIPGALAIPIGESRGIGSSRTKSGSVSGTFGATLSKSGQTTSAHELSVFHAAANTVHVTYTITESEGSDWGISGGLSNEKGSSESSLFAVTYAFDLASKEGANAFLQFVAVPLPPATGSRRVSVRTLNTQEDHDKYAMLGGAADWTGTTWQNRVEDEGGTHEQYGGQQSQDQDPGRVWKFLGDKALHSNAQIVRSQENDKEATARAVLSISGESGSFNRDEFRKIFQDSRYSDAKPSGQWTLSAPVPMAAIHALEAVSPALRRARTLDEKMTVYAELVKENGAQMLGGQVGMSNKAWDLELKGDENFPGPSGRQQLREQRKALADTLKAKPPKADDVIRETGEVLARLQQRRAAVADPKRYTDLPDGLRKQQLALIDRHVEEFQSVRRNAQAVAMRSQPEGADGAKGVGAAPKADRETTKLQDRIHAAEVSSEALRSEIRTSSRALGDAIGSKGTTAIKVGTDAQVAQIQIALARSWIAQATATDKGQAALDPKITEVREAWTAADSRAARVAALTSLAQVLEERVRLMRQTIAAIREAGKAVFPITTRNAVSGHPEFWQSLGMAETEEEPAGTTSMRL